MASHQISGRVLLIDLAISKNHDVGDPRLIGTILSWIAQGAISGILIAPPCETWSEARWLPTECDTDSRPLRTAIDPFGLQSLTLREWEQIQVSSFLLFVTFRILLAAAMKAVPALLEHPREPKRQDRASIWRLPWMQFLKHHCGLEQHLIWQAEYGADVPKSTHIGTLHLPAFRRIMRQHRQ